MDWVGLSVSNGSFFVWFWWAVEEIEWDRGGVRFLVHFSHTEKLPEKDSTVDFLIMYI